MLNAQIPKGPLAEKWSSHKFNLTLVNPANKRKYTVIVVGTGLAGASAAASMAELGYNVLAFSYHESPRRAHSIAAQGGINAAKNYQNDGDSIFRLFYDTIKGGDYRSREANVYRLAEISNNIIDQCVAQGVPFAREYGGHLSNRSFGGAQVSRTFYARGQTGQQLLLGAYSALIRQMNDKKVKQASFVEHLIELRSRLLKSIVYLFILFIFCYIFAENIYTFLVQPYADAVKNDGTERRLIFTALHETFITYLKVAFFAAFFLTSPIILTQIWKFVAPGLYKNEKRALLPYLIATPTLFLLGGMLVYYLVMPLAIKFFLSFESTAQINSLPIQLEAKVNEYLSLIMRLIFAFGISFQLPVLLS